MIQRVIFISRIMGGGGARQNPDIFSAAVILVCFLMVSLVVVTVMGPLIDEIDEVRDTINMRSFDTAAGALDQIHVLFYGMIIFATIVMIIWFFKTQIYKTPYSRYTYDQEEDQEDL